MPPMSPSIVASIRGQSRQTRLRVLYWSQFELYTSISQYESRWPERPSYVYKINSKFAKCAHFASFTRQVIIIFQKKYMSPLVLLLVGRQTA